MMGMRDVMVYGEYIEGRVHPITYELLGKGREIADRLRGKVISVLIGKGANRYAKELIFYGADEVYLYEEDDSYRPDPFIHKYVVTYLIKNLKPCLVLFGATLWGKSLAPRIAAALRTGLTADCIDIYVDDEGDIVQVRPAFTGNIIAYIKTLTRPVMATVRYKVFKPIKKDCRRAGKVNVIKMLIKRRGDLEVLGKVRDKEVSIVDYDVIVAGGRGLRRKEDLNMLKELAELLGGTIAVSRPLVDMGWAPKDLQVGFSGNIVKPKVYIACGISGSPQHIAGMKDSKVVISINIDPTAPIGKYSDIFIVGDLYEVVPKLIERIKTLKKT